MDPITRDAIGCYGEGALGHQHTRERCADALEYYAEENFTSRGLPVPPDKYGALSGCVEMLRSHDGYADARDEYAACDWLNENAPFDGAHWGWQAGDFGLWLVDEEG